MKVDSPRDMQITVSQRICYSEVYCGFFFKQTETFCM